MCVLTPSPPTHNVNSVLTNQLLAAAYAGANSGVIPPLKIFDPETSNVLMVGPTPTTPTTTTTTTTANSASAIAIATTMATA